MRVEWKRASHIRMAERDYFLGLHNGWPREPDDWLTEGAPPLDSYLWREVAGIPPDGTSLFEAIVRFPSAPIYGIHRKFEYHHKLTRINFHTLRVLRRMWEGVAPPPVHRVYLLHNGLNEIDNMGFYYTLASLLTDETSACILRPFPGHLTRSPMNADYAERPLDRYLVDAGDLYRQFLRFMIEAQWLLSILVPLRTYRVIPGLHLLAEGDDTTPGRCNTSILADAVFKHWRSAHRANAADRDAGAQVEKSEIKQIIETLRHLIGWQEDKRLVDASPSKTSLIPAFHAVGYSLGGFLAQSLFFTWPFATSSCTTLFSGGPLRSIAPKVFAHPAEWESVMHALRFEIESAMLAGRLRSAKNGSVAGIPRDTFSYLDHIFADVFLRDFLPTYRTKIVEFLDRLFFVVGGHDPIIRLGSVMEASPPEGINMLQIANLSHFPWSAGTEPEEAAQEFWIPQVARVTNAFARKAEDTLARTLARNWWNVNQTEVVSSPGREERPPRRARARPKQRLEGVDIDLPEEDYELQLGEMVNLLSAGGWLWLFRNDVPAALREYRAGYHRGVLHRQDDRIREHIERLRERQKTMLQHSAHVTIVIPSQLKEWVGRETAVLSPKGEASHVPTRAERRQLFRSFQRTWAGAGALRQFEPGQLCVPRLRELVSDVRQRSDLEDLPSHPVVSVLPDVWIAVDHVAAEHIAGGPGSRNRRAVEVGFGEWALRLLRQDEDVQSDLRAWLQSGQLRVVRLSAAAFNPRYLGQRLWDVTRVSNVILHSALCYSHSRPMGRRRRKADP